MHKALIMFSVLIIMIGCKSKKPIVVVPEIINFDFPLDWIGNYQGDLEIFNSRGDTVTVDMQLSIGHADNTGFFPWILSYNNDDIRSYGLEVINPDKGHYRIDEFNSIKIDAYLRAGHLISRFDVMGSDLLVDYFRVPGGIDVKFYISQSQSDNITGDQIIGKDTIPLVKSFNVMAFQHAFLKRIE